MRGCIGTLSRCFAMWIALATVGFWGGCSPGKPASVAGGGNDGGTDTIPIHCSGNTACKGTSPNQVFVCNRDGSLGALMATCDDDLVCSLGRCVSPICAAGEAHASVTGCLFYVTVLDNVASDDSKPTMLVVTNPGLPGSNDAAVQLQERGAASTWTMTQSMSVSGGSAGSFTFVKEMVEASSSGDPPPPPAPARRVVSDTPVTVLMVESDDEDSMATSSGGTMVLPAHALGTNYMAMTYQQYGTPKVLALAGSRGGAAEISVVATQDHTSLWIYSAGLPTTAMPLPVSLDHDGDVYQIFSDDDLDDPAGTMIISDQRVAVFSGNITTTYGQAVMGLNSPDMAMEQMMPMGSWSHMYVAAQLPAQTGACTSIFPDGATSVWQVIAEDDTDVTFTSASGQPPPGLPERTHLGKGLHNEYFVGPTDFVVRGEDAPILVTQGIDCEPTLASAIPVDAPNDVQVITLVPNFDHVLAIVRKNSGRVILDGSDISGQFVAVSSEFEVARVSIPPCYGSVDQCVHRLTGAFGVTLRGMDVSSSYSTTFPSWPQCFNADACYP